MAQSVNRKGLVIVTGASSGIGRSCAQVFSKEGYPVLLLGRRLERMTELKLPNSICESVDVADQAAFENAVKKAEQQFGPAEVLVNNAGVMLLAKVHTQDNVEIKKMIDTNVYGVIYGTQAVLKGMLERKSGTIINVSSVAGKKPFPNHAVYCATKYAVHGFTQTLREETASTGVRVILISPGVIETELLDHTSSDKIKEDYREWKKSLIGRVQPEDVARVILFAAQQPQHVCLREIEMASTFQVQ